MAEKVLVTKTYLTGIANGLRNITGSTSTMTPSEMVTSAENISNEVNIQTAQIATNDDLINQIKSDVGGGSDDSEKFTVTCDTNTTLDCVLKVFTNYENKSAIIYAETNDYIVIEDIIVLSGSYESITNIYSKHNVGEYNIVIKEISGITSDIQVLVKTNEEF